MTISPDDWAEASATKVLDMAEMDALIRESVRLWDDHDGKKKVASEAYALATEHDAKILQALKDAGKQKYVVDGVGTISIRQQEVVRVPSGLEEKQAFFRFLRDQGAEVFYSLVSVNSQTLNSWYRQKSEENSRLGIAGFSAPGLGDPTMRETLSFTTAKKGK